MFEKLRKTLSANTGSKQPRTLKHYVAYVIFAAIIVVFALFGVKNSQSGDATGGVAAVVNDSTISIAEYRSRVESVEQNARSRFDQFPEAQRKALAAQLRKRALEELILSEIVFQAADRKGVIASDAEVRDYILQIPFLLENGRFLRERYRAFLQNMNLTTADFERQVRKQLVTQKLQELFVGSASPTREELRRNRVLANQKVNMRYIEVPRAELSKLITDAEVRAFVAEKKPEIEKYYNDNKTEFTHAEKVKARHILIAVNEKRSEADANKLAGDLRKLANPQNFADMAKKNSDDPGSREKGGDLGEFEHGRMNPQFEQKAFALKAGEISEPVKTDFGYHLILVEAKIPGRVEELGTAQTQIARKLLARNKEADVTPQLLVKAGGKWQETGEFDLSSNTIPKIGENPTLMNAILKRGAKGGLISEVVDNKGNLLAAEIISWKEAPDKNPDVEGIDRMVAFRKSADLIEGWSKEVESKASVQRNPLLMQ